MAFGDAIEEGTISIRIVNMEGRERRFIVPKYIPTRTLQVQIQSAGGRAKLQVSVADSSDVDNVEGQVQDVLDATCPGWMSASYHYAGSKRMVRSHARS